MSTCFYVQELVVDTEKGYRLDKVAEATWSLLVAGYFSMIVATGVLRSTNIATGLALPQVSCLNSLRSRSLEVIR